MPSKQLRIGVFGGTFDPVHHVHLMIAAEAVRALNLDRLLFVPVGRPSHKDSRGVAPAADRYAMVSLATAPYGRFAVDSVDVRRPGPTYTVDTLRELRREYPDKTKFYFIAGADTLAQVPTWRQADELPALAHFLGSTRTGHWLIDPGLPAGRVSLLRIPLLDVSSTIVRGHARAGAPIDRLVPAPVADYIRRGGLYQRASDMGPL